jgi:regulator of protease activity HflC (stomatin/prohibitin superfamily)
VTLDRSLFVIAPRFLHWERGAIAWGLRHAAFLTPHAVRCCRRECGGASINCESTHSPPLDCAMSWILPLVILLIVLFIGTSSFKIIGQAEVMVIERLGRFNRIARSGFNVLIPFIERPRTIDVRFFGQDVQGVKRVTSGSTSRIDLREQVLNFPSQPVITKDNVTIDIDAVMYYRVADPQKATYSVQNLPFALETLTRTALRNIVGEMELDTCLTSRDGINTRMRETIEEASIGWGVDVTRVELQSIEPPRDIQQSMELQMRAERERRASVTNAEATKRAQILEAEGSRESQIQKAQGEREASILRATGLAEARLAMAEAEAEAIRRIAQALPDGQVAMYLLGQKYLEMLPALAAGKGSTVFLPAEAAGMMGALGGIKELLNRTSGGSNVEPAKSVAALLARVPGDGPPTVG